MTNFQISKPMEVSKSFTPFSLITLNEKGLVLLSTFSDSDEPLPRVPIGSWTYLSTSYLEYSPYLQHQFFSEKPIFLRGDLDVEDRSSDVLRGELERCDVRTPGALRTSVFRESVRPVSSSSSGVTDLGRFHVALWRARGLRLEFDPFDIRH